MLPAGREKKVVARPGSAPACSDINPLFSVGARPLSSPVFFYRMNQHKSSWLLRRMRTARHLYIRHGIILRISSLGWRRRESHLLLRTINLSSSSLRPSACYCSYLQQAAKPPTGCVTCIFSSVCVFTCPHTGHCVISKKNAVNTCVEIIK